MVKWWYLYHGENFQVTYLIVIAEYPGKLKEAWIIDLLEYCNIIILYRPRKSSNDIYVVSL